ncbi:hypothetical protein OIU77_006871 [Salix suchowensis]|uniref:Uncharacterized protein n=1 Tax=Salix suchowensis TaxID=1278906 RepID=A0ABQ9AP75_9ROSI|nr:hypothetical protein OIU77_006871 [Salix suchowensis]
MADVPAEESTRAFRFAAPLCDEEDQENMEKCLMDTDSTADESKINDAISKGSKGVITFEGLTADLLEDLEAASKQREIEDDIEWILTEILKVDVYSFPSNDSRI